MYRELENPMVMDSQWRHVEKEPQIIGECAGCEEDITANEQWLDMELGGQNYLVHQDTNCTYEFVSGMSRCCGGEE